MQAIPYVFLAIILFFPATASADAETEVRQTFQAYRQALLNQNGVNAWETVDSHTRQYYEDVSSHCLHLEREDLNRLDHITKYTILRLRLEFRKAQLEKMDGKKLFVYSIDKGWISKSTVQSIQQMEKVTFDENLAQGYIAESPDIPVLYFIKEKEEWYLALLKSFELANLAFKQMFKEAKEKGMSEDTFIKIMLEQVSEFKVDDRIFDGPIQ